MNDLEIRPTRPDDLKQIEGVFKSWRPSDWDRKYAKAYFSGYFRDGTSPDAIFVGTLDEKIVGVTGYCPERLETKGIYWLGWHYVHKKNRGQHHGKRLLEHVIDELRSEKSARKLYVNTSSLSVLSL